LRLDHAAILALVQAITEFLPVSSSGHLILLPRLLGWADQGLEFDIATNTGTLLAVVAYYRRELKDLIVGFFTGARVEGEDFEPRRLALQLAVGTIPAAVAGLLFHDSVATVARNPLLIAANAAFFGLLMLAADRYGRRERGIADLSWGDVAIIGLAQALALNPGTSRSGITITAALFLGLARPAAARFSFLLSIPIGILAAGHSLAGTVGKGVAPEVGWPATLVGIAVSAVAGYLVIGWLLGWLRQRSLTVFGIYRLLLALVIAGMFWR
jgi:undecaprenyl-diphosphatase